MLLEGGRKVGRNMKRPYVITLKDGKRRIHFNTVAKSESDALRIVRKFHRGKHIESISTYSL